MAQAKLLNALILIFVINAALILFTDVAVPGSSLWTLLQNPQNWSNLDLIDFITDSFVVIGTTAIVVGSLLGKADFAIFATIATVFFSFGATLYNFWQYINSQGIWAGAEGWIAVIFVSPLLLAYIYVILSFWRGTD
jgi:hypothetical protein